MQTAIDEVTASAPEVIDSIMAAADVATKLLRTRQAAEYLSCSEWTLRKLVQDEKIPHVLFGEGGVWRFDVADLDKFIDSRRQLGS